MSRIQQNALHFQYCEAIFCTDPRAQDGLIGIWYPDEPICRLRSEASHLLPQGAQIVKALRNQKHIATLAERGLVPLTDNWTWEELLKIRRVAVGIRGTDCDELSERRGPKRRLKQWMRVH